MASTNKKSLLVVVRHSPYGSSLARTALEVALSSATFDQDVSVLFIGDGVLHLLPDQDSCAIGVRSIAKLIASFPLYDLGPVFADAAALRQYGLGEKEIPPRPFLQRFEEPAMRALFCRYDHILSF